MPLTRGRAEAAQRRGGGRGLHVPEEEGAVAAGGGEVRVCAGDGEGEDRVAVRGVFLDWLDGWRLGVGG